MIPCHNGGFSLFSVYRDAHALVLTDTRDAVFMRGLVNPTQYLKDEIIAPVEVTISIKYHKLIHLVSICIIS